MNDKSIKYLKYQWQTLLLLFVTGGIFGFIYEEIFYWIDLGYLVKRGSTYGPWIPIYGFGAVIIILLIKRMREKPLLVFVIAAVVSGLIEFISGYLLFHNLHMRLWDYNTEIWNWGNIGGYVCIRSVLFFAVSAMFFQYIIMPLLMKFTQNVSKKTVNILAIGLATLFVCDILINVIVNGV